MKSKLLIILNLIFILPGCIGVVERSSAVYVEPRPTVIVAEPVYEVVVIHGVPVRRVVVVSRPIIVHRHHH